MKHGRVTPLQFPEVIAHLKIRPNRIGQGAKLSIIAPSNDDEENGAEMGQTFLKQDETALARFRTRR